MKQWSLLAYLLMVGLLWAGCWGGTPAVSSGFMEDGNVTGDGSIAVEAAAGVIPAASENGIAVRMACILDLVWDNPDMNESLYANMDFMTLHRAKNLGELGNHRIFSYKCKKTCGKPLSFPHDCAILP